MYTRVRKVIRNQLFQFVRKIAATDDGRAIVIHSLRGLLSHGPNIQVLGVPLTASPYAEIGTRTDQGSSGDGDGAVFITARFRSGSTLLWNVFRQIPNVTAYYEPFNERRWFDPETRGTRVDSTHRKVQDYWREYDGLAKLGQLYRHEWTHRNLYMDRDSWDLGMRQYVQTLIAEARGRPILQFNRIDFRLPWFRAQFPKAKIIHLYRHPRDQWCSFLMDLKCFPASGTCDEFSPHDKFYLESWANDLKYHFPFLDKGTMSHPYQMFYFIWKLSYLFGLHFSDYSFAFESLLDNPQECLAELLERASIRDYNMPELCQLIEPQRSRNWQEYADDSWFRKHESDCESIVAQYFRQDSTHAIGHRV